MEIRLNKLGKRFNREWIFRNLDLGLASGKSYAIIGPNGSGKSTLLKVLSGYLPATAGKIEYHKDGVKTDPDMFYRNLIYVAPYLELVEEFTLDELLDFHFRFKKIKAGYTKSKIIGSLGLGNSAKKTIHDYSSGMKQRVKLGLAFYSEAEAIFLDEPTVNLDDQGFQWFLDEIVNMPKSKLILIASNQEKEYQWALEQINIMECKI
jgi:ABC-type multidrug transport system ATPase subunit